MPRAKGSRAKTSHPGVYKLATGGYEYVWRNAQGKQQSGRAPTSKAAREAKAREEALAKRGHAYDADVTLAAYAREWIAHYQGRTARGFRETSRAEYRRQLEDFAIEFFGEKQKLATLSPRQVRDFVAWLTKRDAGRKKEPTKLSDATIRRIMAPLKACLSTAVEDGIIASNPCASVRLPNAPKIEEDGDSVPQALTTQQLRDLILCAGPTHGTIMRFLAVTGLRISECVAVRWRDLTLDGAAPEVRVRRAYVKGVVGPPKSKHSRRDIPLSADIVRELRERKAAAADRSPDGLVFPHPNGGLWRPEGYYTAAMVPAAQEASVPWAGWHALRHTCATRLFAEGRNAKQVQRWLGHHSAAFTLETYVHLLDDDLGGPLVLPEGDSMGTAREAERTGDVDSTIDRILS